MASDMTAWFDSSPFSLDSGQYTVVEIIESLSVHATSERLQRLQQVASGRTNNVVPVLENLYDRGNISAVMRSAEAFGFYNFNIVEPAEAQFKAANRVTQGTDKWLKIKKHQAPSVCIKDLQSQGYKVYATHLDASVPIDEIDFTQPSAVIFGNEKDGVSEDSLELVDGRFIIPMHGFAQSFNISVAAALTFYHIHQFRARHLEVTGDLDEEQKNLVLANYLLRSVQHAEDLLKRKCRG